ncbi:YfjI family protein [Pseudomonas coleopterorum]|uniref:DUF3987 domain-containing protein n=1 Tax=Pseudomonas coleopterorum TaxID=1605838 RepID=A0ABR9C083_9PSED|nr:YfjI family protein [Pseudomonas coleopterorum]MBD8770099.1 DUF3987 domain-containing protein [Pseudomonas coleopterorum]MDY1019169.1 YfjI family protein [Pseudomonas coleopterorum]
MYHSYCYPALPIPGAPYPAPSLAHPCFSSAVLEAAENLKLPHPFVCLTALSAIAAVLQELVDIEMPSGNALPVSLNTLITVPSGGGKNRTINLFKRSIEEFETQQVLASKGEMAAYKTKFEIWSHQRKDLLKKQCKVLSGDELVELMIAHDQKAPIPPKPFRMVFEDTTPEALLGSLGAGGHGAWLVTSEGGIILSQHSMKNMPALNQLWSGDRVTVDRKTTGSFVLADVRISVLIMSQPGIFEDFINRYGGLARESGFFARCLVLAVPPSVIGQYEDDQVLDWQNLEQFHVVLRRFLSMSVSGISRSAVRFSPAARSRWVVIKNAVVDESKMGGRFTDFPDLAARTPENIARISALLHFFEGRSGDITVETLDYACRLCFWHIDQFVQMFSKRSTGEEDAKILFGWFLGRYNNNSQVAHRKTAVRQACPNSLRKDGRFNAAFELLASRGYVATQVFGKGAQGVIFYPRGYGNG